jgi:hypothetical protein
MGGDTRSSVATLRAAERERQVLELRLRGAPFEDIAAQLGFSISGAFRAYQRALGRTPESPLALKRKEHQQRLDRIRTRLCAKFGATSSAKELAQLSREIVRVDDREAKLLGLDTQRRSYTFAETVELDGLKAEQQEQQQEKERMLDILRVMSSEERAVYLVLMTTAEARIKCSKDRNKTPP